MPEATITALGPSFGLLESSSFRPGTYSSHYPVLPLGAGGRGGIPSMHSICARALPRTWPGLWGEGTLWRTVDVKECTAMGISWQSGVSHTPYRGVWKRSLQQGHPGVSPTSLASPPGPPEILWDHASGLVLPVPDRPHTLSASYPILSLLGGKCSFLINSLLGSLIYLFILFKTLTGHYKLLHSLVPVPLSSLTSCLSVGHQRAPDLQSLPARSSACL